MTSMKASRIYIVRMARTRICPYRMTAGSFEKIPAVAFEKGLFAAPEGVKEFDGSVFTFGLLNLVDSFNFFA